MSGVEPAVHRCAVCGHRMFPPRLGCSACGSDDLRLEAAGPGTVVGSATILRSPSGTGGPVTVVLVEVAGGTRILAGAGGELVRGAAVTLSATGHGIRAHPA